MQERIERSDKRARYWFESLAELARYLDNTPKTWHSNSSTGNAATRSWDLGAGYEKAWELARYGWLEGAQQAQEALKAFTPTTPAPDTKTDFYGHMPHVPRFCAGAPDCMVRKIRTPQAGAGKVLTLIVPVNATARVDAKYMRNFGLGIAQYINQLETDGIRVEVFGAFCSSISGWRVSHIWRVKRADQPLDLAVLAFAIGHPAMFRRLGFALRERCAAPQDWAYGQSVPVRADDAINAPAGAVVLNGMIDADRHARTPQTALAYITQAIDKAMEAA